MQIRPSARETSCNIELEIKDVAAREGPAVVTENIEYVKRRG